MEGITVRELARDCNDLVRMGYGDRTVFISKDDEGNEYHTLCFTFTVDDQTLRSAVDYGMLRGRSDPSEIVLLG